jgi:hypothetical protein
MARTTDMADILRKAGCKVIEIPGWKERGHGALSSVSAIICHHTATNADARGNYPSLGIVRDGRSDLAGPLAQLGLGRDGTWYVIAAGISWHAGATQYTWQNNWNALGVEAEAEGTGDSRDWPKVQMDSYARGVAALAKAFGIPNGRVLGHKEIASAVPGGKPNGRKIDPSFNMDAFRAAVASSHTTPTQEVPDMDATQARQLSETRALVGHLKSLLDEVHAGTAPKIDKTAEIGGEKITLRTAIKETRLAVTGQLAAAVQRGVTKALADVTGVDKVALTKGVVAEVSKAVEALTEGTEYVLTPKEK